MGRRIYAGHDSRVSFLTSTFLVRNGQLDTNQIVGFGAHSEPGGLGFQKSGAASANQV